MEYLFSEPEYNTTAFMDVTTASPGSTIPLYWGFIAAAVAVLFFGSNFLPVKKFETGDGMFFQWVLCCSIWLTGLCVHAIRHFPPFYPLAMLGGFLWASGNIMVVPIVKTIGLSIGLCIWAVFNMMSGWASSRFGLFGFQEIPSHSALNYAGVFLCFSSAFIFMLVRSDAGPILVEEGGEKDNLLDGRVNAVPLIGAAEPELTFIDKLSPKMKRISGIVMSVISGTLYGVNFSPVIYIYETDHYKDDNPSKNGLDYVFAHFTGIFVTSSVYFFIYCAVRKNKPRVYPAAILPAFASGVMWAVADSGWFVANAVLSEPVSFPIVTTLPPLVGSLWGVFFLKEIKGKRNYLLLLLAFCISCSGAVLAGVSKLG